MKNYFQELQTTYGDELPRVLDSLISVCELTDKNVMIFTAVIRLSNLYPEGHRKDFPSLLARLFSSMEPDEINEVADQLGTLNQWLNSNPQGVDFLKTFFPVQFKKIVTASAQNVNHTIEISKLVKAAVSRDYVTDDEDEDDDPYAREAAEGFISQGSDAVAEFKELLRAGRFDDSRRSDIESRFANILNGQQVYVVPSIIKSQDDFVLGYRDSENGRIYITEEIYTKLNERPHLLSEYLYHESNCRSDNHYQMIARQQQLFPENYEKSGIRKKDCLAFLMAKGKKLAFFQT